MGQTAAGAELGGSVAPASTLGAAHRHIKRSAGGDQDRGVENAVLLGTFELLAIEEQDVLWGFIDHPQIRHRSAFADFRDFETIQGQCLDPREVSRRGSDFGKHRPQADAIVDPGIAQFERGKQAGDRGVERGFVGRGISHAYNLPKGVGQLRGEAFVVRCFFEKTYGYAYRAGP